MSSSPLHRFHSARTGSSTAQANLAKILSIIVTVSDANDISTTAPEIAVNLDLKLGLSLEMPQGSEAFTTTVEKEEERIPTAHSGVVNCPNQTLSYEASTVNKVSKKAPSAADSVSEADTSSEGECSPVAATMKEISEITNTSCQDKEAQGRGGYLDLLLEAARQVSSECANDLDDETDKKRKRSSTPPMRSKQRKKSSTVTEAATAAFNVCDETEPIVRSRRGRNQALPLRFRDSVLDPWRKPPTVFRR